MRKRFVQIGLELVEVDRYWHADPRADFHVMRDIVAYRSMIDGSVIGSRSRHREHLREHACIEIGNEVKHMKPFGDYAPPPGRKEAIIRAFNDKERRR